MKHLRPRSARILGIVLTASLAPALFVSCNRAKPVDTLEIFIRDNKFHPSYVRAERAQTVWWINETDEQHVISFEGFDWVEIFVAPRGKKGFSFTESREYRMYCKIHNFKGRLLVVEPEA